MAASPTTSEEAPTEGNAPAHPLAVVWCRQVDNEAESPGYTTIPEEFPGRHETLAAVRAVGHLTINRADTHDYWDPEPGLSLSYYPNLFLYPAHGNRYTCVGRMFLSKEDRPRLGMKTFVLQTSDLLGPSGFGASVLGWYASMGKAGREQIPRPAARDPSLYSLVAEGMLGLEGSGEPVLLVGSEQWELAMRVVLDMLRQLPAAVLSLGGILSFPYFISPSGFDLDEFHRHVPLSLALMRVTAHDADGPRHSKRIQGWTGLGVTVHDLAVAPPTAGKRREGIPFLIRAFKDGEEARLDEIRRRVDAVELPKLRASLPESSRWNARARRREIARIGAAMERTASVLMRSGARGPGTSDEAGRRAKLYLDAAIAEPPGRKRRGAGPLPPAVITGLFLPGTPGAATVAEVTGSPKPVEVVPVPTKRIGTALSAPPSKDSATAPAIPEPLMTDEVRRVVDEEVAKRVGPLAERPGPPLPAPGSFASSRSPTTPPARPDAEAPDRSRSEGSLSALREDLLQRLEAEQARIRAAVTASVGAEIERKVRGAVEARLAETGRGLVDAVRNEIGQARRSAVEQIDRAAVAARTKVTEGGPEERAEMLREIDRRIAAAFRDAGPEGVEPAAPPSRARSGTASHQLHAQFEEAEARWLHMMEARFLEIREAQSEAIAGIEQRLAERSEAALRAALQEERAHVDDALAKLRSGFNEALAGSGAAPSSLEIEEGLERVERESRAVLERGLRSVEEKLQLDQADARQRLERLEATLADRNEALTKLESAIRDDLGLLRERTEAFHTRLVPVVRKTWDRVSDLERARGGSAAADGGAGVSRRDLERVSERVDAEIERRIGELRERIETTVAHQGRVWLTLIHQLSGLVGERPRGDEGPNDLTATSIVFEPPPEEEAIEPPGADTPPEENEAEPPPEPPARRKPSTESRRTGRHR